ncbi:MAG: glutamate 5-kinase [Pseudomonadota bacterium]
MKAQAPCWVVKIGSAMITNHGAGLAQDHLRTWAGQIAVLIRQDYRLVLVSSGAVAVGMQRMGWQQRPTALPDLQAAAAVGQAGLIQAWEQAFRQRNLVTAQVLLTHDDLSDRRRYLNARSNLLTLLRLGVVPIINENDVVANDELRFGDNDTLAALVTNLLAADKMILLTDQNGLYTADPRQQPDAELIRAAAAHDPQLNQFASPQGGQLGRGGMFTKIRAARLASRSGADTVIASGVQPNLLPELAQGMVHGTLLRAEQMPETARKRWLAGQLQVAGHLMLDAGAADRLRRAGTSLLAVGIVAVSGTFKRGELASCVDDAGQEVARGLVNYAADEIQQLCGHSSTKIASLLGYVNEEEMIHRDNLVLTCHRPEQVARDAD